MTDLTRTWIFNLFIDDERFPVDDSWIIARNKKEVEALIEKHGLPDFVSFDHDLGENEPTGFEIAQYLCEKIFDLEELTMFDYYVHSQNPIGKKNIEQYLECFRRVVIDGK